MERPNWAPGDIDLERPSVARVYDYWLGGAHNFAADRAVGQKALEFMPELRNVILNHRSFLRRSVRYLLGQGVRQFLDLGSGIPTVGNVHEIAQAADPATKIVYVDIDPVAVAHSRSLLTGNDRVNVLQADVRDPAAVLASPEVNGLLDFDEPIAVLMIALLHFVSDEEKPAVIIGGYRDRLAPGSFIAVSHAGYEADEETGSYRAARAMYDRSVTQMTYRNKAEFSRLLDGFELVEPGVVRLPAWHPESPDDLDEFERPFPAFGAVGRKV
ncbi:S-adenosyl methyltransferase [Lentzea atacamensis]|uniref:S-adenosyl methyltransferase n=2 Tax=Lentzea TaxID=165301 RepID=A0A316IC66_9PSEU|nr:SAM-dependent methyltransferase [Lentzea atacamensis]PWK90410.1 S-adenosyl methyltransferase [Lentzea atacamensis]RAS68368.1 S-adenosyl methyltransferase [Lentzea atacamensis]